MTASRAALDLSGLVSELTARIDGHRIYSGGDTWEATPGDRDPPRP